MHFFISRSVLPILRNVLDKRCKHNQNTFYVQKRLLEKRDVYEITWKNRVQRRQATDENMAHAHCMVDN